MCGITAYYSQNSLFDEEDLRQMTATLAHRGPDAEGFYYDEGIGLGHKRLKILDLSDRANQPYHSANQRYVMVYNGEVYNYEAISTDLAFKTKTTSDTEVIIEAFAQKGADCISEFNGMFTMIIYDKQRKQLHVIRDRIGIKPLFYYCDGTNYAFASEIKALLKVKAIQTKILIDEEIIGTFLHLGYIPEPYTIYKNIYKFPSGHSALLSDGKMQISKYWDLNDHIKDKPLMDFASAKKQLKTLVEDSVTKRLKTDMPYGVFLSGGIDSSLITAITQRVSGNRVKTFTIGFEDSKYNEANYAKNIAKYLGTDHHELILSHKEAIPLMDAMMNVYDEPFIDSSAIPTMLVSKMAREHVAVTLSGDGGDELFMGYGSYIWAERLAKPLVKFLRAPIGKTLSLLDNRSKRAAYHFQYSTDVDIKSQIFAQEQYLFSISEITNLLQRPSVAVIKLKHQSTVTSRELNASEEQALFDIRFYLKDDLLVKVDRASMLSSLETRVPLLDHRIVEFSAGIGTIFKRQGNKGKILLKSLLSDYVPTELSDRPKRGFSMPMSQWLKEDLSHLIEDYLSPNGIERIGIVKKEQVQSLITRFRSGEDYLFNRLWCLIVLHKFLSSV